MAIFYTNTSSVDNLTINVSSSNVGLLIVSSALVTAYGSKVDFTFATQGVSGSFSGSYAGSGINLTSITASYIDPSTSTSASYASTSSTVNGFTINQNLNTTDQVIFGGITSSLVGTASWAESLAGSVNSAVSASWASSSISASYSSTTDALNGFTQTDYVQNSSTSSFVTNDQTSSMTVLSASYAGTASILLGSVESANSAISASWASSSISASYASTASFATNLTASIVSASTNIITNTLQAKSDITASKLYLSDTGGAVIDVANASSFTFDAPTGTFLSVSTTGDVTIQNELIVTNNLTANGGVTGSLLGTASYAETSSYSTSFTASSAFIGSNTLYALNIYNTQGGAQVWNGGTLSFTLEDGHITANQNLTVTGNLTANGGVTGSLLGTASYAETASLLLGSVESANSAVSASWASSSISASYASTASFATNLTASIVSASTRVNTAQVTASSGISASKYTGQAFSRGAAVADITNGFSTSGSYYCWRAPYSCSVINVYGKRQGGTAAEVNARRSSSDGYALHVAANVSLTTADSWTAAGTVQNTNYVGGDSLELIISGTGTPNQVAVQVDFIRI